MRKSKEEALKTRQHIVAEASKFILQNGIETSGVAEIMKSAGLTQGGFYRHFESKEQLIAEASAATFQNIDQTFRSAIKDLSPKKAVEKIVSIYLAQHLAKPTDLLCPIANLGTEFHRLDERLKSIAYEGHQHLVSLLEEQLVELKMKKPSAVASSIGSILVGAILVSRLAPSRESEKIILQDASASIQRLIKS